MTRFKSGTSVPDVEYSNYTAEQMKALEGMKDDAYLFGIARSEFVNKALLPDGTIVDIDEIGDAVAASIGETMDGEPTPARLKAALALAQKSEELTQHIAQERFLFIVNADGAPVIYFQCAVDGNPDLPLRVEHDDHRAEQAERRERIAKVIDDAHQAEKVRAAAKKAEA